MIRAVFFDMGGVLLHATQAAATRARWERRLDLPDGWILSFLNSDFLPEADAGSWTEDEVWRGFATGIGAAEHVHEISQDAWWWDTADLELLSFAAEIRSSVRLGIISNAWPGARTFACDRFGLIEAFDEIVLSSEERCAKPDPRIYELALDRLHVSAEEAVFIDDHEPYVQAASELGFYGVLHISTHGTTEALKELLR